MNTSKQKTYIINKVAAIIIAVVSCSITAMAQDVIVNPEISYAGTPRTCTIGGIAVKCGPGVIPGYFGTIWALM